MTIFRISSRQGLQNSRVKIHDMRHEGPRRTGNSKQRKWKWWAKPRAPKCFLVKVGFWAVGQTHNMKTSQAELGCRADNMCERGVNTSKKLTEEQIHQRSTCMETHSSCINDSEMRLKVEYITTVKHTEADSSMRHSIIWFYLIYPFLSLCWCQQDPTGVTSKQPPRCYLSKDVR